MISSSPLLAGMSAALLCIAWATLLAAGTDS
jgi:hypothetical protein